MTPLRRLFVWTALLALSIAFWVCLIERPIETGTTVLFAGLVAFGWPVVRERR